MCHYLIQSLHVIRIGQLFYLEPILARRARHFIQRGKKFRRLHKQIDWTCFRKFVS